MAETIVKDKKLNNLIRQKVIETIYELLADPDFGLELQGWVKERLRKKPDRFIPFEEIKKKYQ